MSLGSGFGLMASPSPDGGEGEVPLDLPVCIYNTAKIRVLYGL